MHIPIICDHKTGFHLAGFLSHSLNKNYYIKNLINYKISFKKFVFYLFCKKLLRNYKKIIFVRNPVNILVSSYLYHLQCTESWCIKINNPEGYVMNFFHWSPFSRNNLRKFCRKISNYEILNNSSYQSQLQQMPAKDGMIFDYHKSVIFTLIGMQRMFKIMNLDNSTLVIDCDIFTQSIEYEIERINLFLDNSISKEKLFRLMTSKQIIDTHNRHKTSSINRTDLSQLSELIINDRNPSIIQDYKNIISKFYN
jgi:hypothetical protein